MRLKRVCTAYIISVLAILLTGADVQPCHAQGVSIAPLRVLFDGKMRSATVFLSNRTPEVANYRIYLVNRRMLEDGSIVPAEVAGDGEFFGDEIIRFSPRRVTIPAFGSQTIRLLVRRPRGDFPENVEFRTHLSVRSVPATPHLTDLENEELLVSEGKLTVTAVATIETVIPIIIRMGNPSATVELANPVLDLGTNGAMPQLTIDLVRLGQRSVYGDLTIEYINPAGHGTEVHLTRGIAVYSPTNKRVRTMKLKNVTAEMLQQGKLIVRYKENEEMHGKESAEITIQLGRS